MDASVAGGVGHSAGGGGEPLDVSQEPRSRRRSQRREPRGLPFRRGGSRDRPLALESGTMIPVGQSVRVYAATKPTDMRKSYDTLAHVVKSEMGRDPLSGELYLFTNSRLDQTSFCIQNRLSGHSISLASPLYEADRIGSAGRDRRADLRPHHGSSWGLSRAPTLDVRFSGVFRNVRRACASFIVCATQDSRAHRQRWRTRRPRR